MARQVTILEFSMYEKIQAKECIGQAWNGKKKHLLAPNISNCIAFTNQVSFFLFFLYVLSLYSFFVLSFFFFCEKKKKNLDQFMGGHKNFR